MAGLLKLSTVLLLLVIIGVVSSAVLGRENVENEEFLRRYLSFSYFTVLFPFHPEL
jgi:hypothetical protein